MFGPNRPPETQKEAVTHINNPLYMSISTLTTGENPLQRGPSALEKLIELAEEIKDSIRSYSTSLSNETHKIEINIPRQVLTHSLTYLLAHLTTYPLTQT